ncbi:MAG TPA: hypothetical protein VL463_28380 [Kofleriaceae bacterium]|nr:hypothetical protein [Kofleriaceae bacterium]
MARWLLVLFTLAACKARHMEAPDARAAMPDGDAGAVEAAAQACTIGDFYWEIGDADGVIVSGSIGTTYGRATEMDIASATKLVFGAYVVEKYKDDLSQIDARAMHMTSGYHSMLYGSCLGKTTVDDCLSTNNNGKHTDGDDDAFYYNSGHFQHYASAVLGLGADDDAALEAKLGIPFSSPQLAAGGHASAGAYAAFLVKIIKGELAIHDHLGEDAVCTLPGSCPRAIYSPAAPYDWHYSYGHWIEDDGAFSSPGAFGFYPWIDKTKTYYGIVARKVDTLTAYRESAECGRAIRRAFFDE